MRRYKTMDVQDTSGPSKHWAEKSLYGINVSPVNKATYRRAALTVASSSTGAEDCSLLLDYLGIDIQEVWS